MEDSYHKDRIANRRLHPETLMMGYGLEDGAASGIDGGFPVFFGSSLIGNAHPSPACPYTTRCLFLTYQTWTQTWTVGRSAARRRARVHHGNRRRQGGP